MFRLTTATPLAAAIVLAAGLVSLHGATAASDRNSDRIEPKRRMEPMPGLRQATCARDFGDNLGRFNRLGSGSDRDGHGDESAKPYVCSYVTRIVCKPGMVADRPSLQVNSDGTMTVRYICRKGT